MEINNDELEKLVQEIFQVIPSYYDKKEADKVKKLILDFLNKLLKQG